MTHKCGDKESVFNFLCWTKFYSLLEKDIHTQVRCLNPKDLQEAAYLEADLAPLVGSGFYHDSALRKDGRHRENNKSCGPPYGETTTALKKKMMYIILTKKMCHIDAIFLTCLFMLF